MQENGMNKKIEENLREETVEEESTILQGEGGRNGHELKRDEAGESRGEYWTVKKREEDWNRKREKRQLSGDNRTIIKAKRVAVREAASDRWELGDWQVREKYKEAGKET